MWILHIFTSKTILGSQMQCRISNPMQENQITFPHFHWPKYSTKNCICNSHFNPNHPTKFYQKKYPSESQKHIKQIVIWWFSDTHPWFQRHRFHHRTLHGRSATAHQCKLQGFWHQRASNMRWEKQWRLQQELPFWLWRWNREQKKKQKRCEEEVREVGYYLWRDMWAKDMSCVINAGAELE